MRTLALRQSLRAAIALGTALACAGSLAVTRDLVRPEPGLYRVEFDSKFGPESRAASIALRRDGSSGDTVSTTEVGGSKNTRSFKGDGPVTRCIKPYGQGDLAALVPALPVACKQDSVTETSAAIVIKTTCASGTSTHTIKPLGAGKWELSTETRSGGAGAGASLAFMIPALQAQAKHAPTEAARAKAAKGLADLPRMQKEMADSNAALIERLNSDAARARTPAEKARIQALAAQIGSTAVIVSNSRMVLTKISELCE